MRYTARLSSLRPKTQERVRSGDLRLPALDAVEPEPISRAARFYLDAWEFVSLWRPAGGGFGLGRVQLADLELYMDEAGVPRSERHFVRRIVGEIDAAYCGEMAALASDKTTGGKGKEKGKEAIEEWRQRHSSSSSS